MKQNNRYKAWYVLGMVAIIMFSGYYHISNEQGYFLHGKLVFPPLVITCITLVGYKVFVGASNRNAVKVWMAFNCFAGLLSLAVALLCILGFQRYLPFVEINLVLNLAISPLPFAILPLLNKALFAGTRPSASGSATQQRVAR